MSTITAPQYTYLDHIPLGRRIREVMVEKGNYYSISAMASRLGINRETYRLMLNGQREIYFFELEKIAHDLKLPIDRLLQKDCQAESKLLSELLSQQTDPQKALSLSNELIEESIGLTERSRALHRQGLAYFFCHQQDEALVSLSKAHELALQIMKGYSDQEVLYMVLTAMMDVFTARKDYLNATKILDQVEPHFRGNSTRAAALHYLHAQIKENLGDLAGAKKHAYESMRHACVTEIKVLIGRTEINTAHYEYLDKNYEQARFLLESAKINLQDDVQTQYIARKELIKVMIKLDENEAAQQEIEDAMNSLPADHNIPLLVGKMRLLRDIVDNSSANAESIVNSQEYGEVPRRLAARYLTEFFRCNGDSEKMMYYYGIAIQLGAIRTDILDEGEM